MEVVLFAYCSFIIGIDIEIVEILSGVLLVNVALA